MAIFSDEESSGTDMSALSDEESTETETSQSDTEQPSPKRSRRTSFSSVKTTKAEEIIGVSFKEVIWNEQLDISKMFDTSKHDDVPNVVLENVYSQLSLSVEGEFPSELVLETSKAPLLRLAVFNQVVHQIRIERNLSNRELFVHSESVLELAGIAGRVDFAVVHKPAGCKERFLLVVEAKTDGPRYALKQLFLYLKKVKMLNPGLEAYFGIATNSEFWQLAVLSDDKFHLSTPRVLIFPRMAEEGEKEYWMNNCSELAKIIYTLVNRALSNEVKFPSAPDDVFAVSYRKKNKKVGKKQQEKTTKYLQWRKATENALKINLSDEIKKEFHQIDSMFKLNPDTPELTELLKKVFGRMSSLLGGQEYPSELRSEITKSPFISVLLDAITDFCKLKFGLNHPKSLETVMRANLSDDPGGFIDFAVTQDLDDRPKCTLFVIEAKKDLPRHALLQCFLQLKEMQKLYPEQKKYYAFATNVEWWQMIIWTGEKFECSTPRALLYPMMRDVNEEANWIASKYSEIARIIFWVVHDSLSAVKQPASKMQVDLCTNKPEQQDSADERDSTSKF